MIAPTMKPGRRPYGHGSVAVQNQGHCGPMCLNRPLRRRGVFPLGPPGRSIPTREFWNDRGAVGGVGWGWSRAQRQPRLFEHFNADFCQSVKLADVSATFDSRRRTVPRLLSIIGNFPYIIAGKVSVSFFREFDGNYGTTVIKVMFPANMPA